MTQEIKLSIQEQLLAEGIANRSLVARRVLLEQDQEPENTANLLCTAGAKVLAVLNQRPELSDLLSSNLIEALGMADYAILMYQTQKSRVAELENKLRAYEAVPDYEPEILPDNLEPAPEPTPLELEPEDEAFNQLDQELNQQG